jgi:hypothetical protein
MDKAIPQDHRKPSKQARFPDAPVQASTYASKLVAGAGQRFESARRLSRSHLLSDSFRNPYRSIYDRREVPMGFLASTLTLSTHFGNGTVSSTGPAL